MSLTGLASANSRRQWGLPSTLCSSSRDQARSRASASPASGLPASPNCWNVSSSSPSVFTTFGPSVVKTTTSDLALLVLRGAGLHVRPWLAGGVDQRQIGHSGLTLL